MLNLIPVDLQETRFRIEGLSKITKIRGADKHETISKNVVEMSQNPWKIGPGTQQKTMLKNRAQKTRKISKNDSQISLQRWGDIKGKPSGAPLVAQTAFVIRKWAPNAPKVPSRIEKWAKNNTKELSELENELHKWTFFGSRRKWTPNVDPFRIQARRTARSAYNYSFIGSR